MKLDKCDLDVVWHYGPGCCYPSSTEHRKQIGHSIELLEAELGHRWSDDNASRTGRIKLAVLRAREEKDIDELA